MQGDGDYPDEEDDFSTSDSDTDMSISDEGGSSPREPPEAEMEISGGHFSDWDQENIDHLDELLEKIDEPEAEGKAVMEINDDNDGSDSGTSDDNDGSDSGQENMIEISDDYDGSDSALDLLAEVFIEDERRGKESHEKDKGELDLLAELRLEDERESKRISKDVPGSKEIGEEDRRDLDHLADLCLEDEKKSKRRSRSSLVLPETKCTIVICPTDALIQWESVIIGISPRRKKSLDEFFESHFVLTTYSTLAAEYRKVMPTKKKVKSSGLEAETSRCKKQQEEEQQENPAGIHHGAASRNSQLLSVKWNHIILDEAHYIKNKHRSTAKAVFALKSSYKGALSGTALQVHVRELYSLVRFLQITPYSYFFCMECDCKSLEYSSKRKCNCVHSMVHFLWWKRYISQPILALEDNVNQNRSRRRAMILLKNKLLKSVALRRTMKGRAAEISFPPKLVLLRRDIIFTGEEDYYKTLYNKSPLQFHRYAAYGTISNNFVQVTQLPTELRQRAAHPFLALFPQAEARKSRYTGTLNYGQKTCSICPDVAEDPVVTSRKHGFRKDCFVDYSAALGEDSCPKKSTTTRVKGTKRSTFINRICLEQLQTSTKVEALVCRLSRFPRFKFY